MLRQTLLLGIAGIAFAGTSQAQQRGRDDLLDALTRHIQICSEITDTQQRLSCFDRLQTEVGGVTPPAAAAAPAAAPAPAITPTPLQATHQPQPTPLMPSTGGSAISSEPLNPQPLGVPGGGVATLGAGTPAASQPQDPNAAFDPRTSTYRPGESLGPKPQTQLRRTGPRPIPYSSSPRPLVTLAANNLTYGPSRYWQVTVTLTSNTGSPISTQAECTFMNAGRAVTTDYLGPIMIQPGEQISTELIGPPTTSYVDASNCKLTSP